MIGCASVMNPEGGDKDSMPPQVLKTEPDSGTLNVRPDKITLQFDEYISVQNPSKEWTISPSPNKFPEYKIKGKSLEIKWLDSLSPSTTYAINFGKSIADINEGNVLKDYRFIFSTGAYIDSFTVNGNIIHAFNAEPGKEMTVFLKDTSTPFQDAGILYKTLSDEKGHFRFDNISNRPYVLFAIEDKNNNKTADKDERLAFYNKPFYPDTNQINLYSFTTSFGKQSISTASCETPGIYVFTLNHPGYYFSVNISPADTTFSYKRMVNPSHDTVTILYNYIKNTPPEFIVTLPDTQYLSSIKMPQFTDSLLRKNHETGQTDCRFIFNQAISGFDTSKIIFSVDSTFLNPSHSMVEIHKNQISIQYPISNKKPSQIILLPGAVTSLFNKTNPTADTFAIRLPEPSKSGSLQFNINDSTGQWIQFDLIKEYKTIQTRRCEGCKTISFNEIPPDIYQIRIQYDLNKNGIIDRGSYPLLLQPEPTLILPLNYKVKPDWQQTDIQLDIPSSTTLSTTR